MITEITEIFATDGSVGKLSIKGAGSQQDAHEAAEAWCEENNCLLLGEDTSDDDEAFVLKVCSDDYKE